MEYSNGALRVRRSEVLIGFTSTAILGYVMHEHWNCLLTLENLVGYGLALSGALALYWGRNLFGSYLLRTGAILGSLLLTALPVTFALVTMHCQMGKAYLALPAAALLVTLLYYFWGTRLYLGAVGARLMRRDDHPALFAMNEALANRNGIAAPMLAFIDSAEPKAFSITGKQNAIVLSVGAMEMLDEDGLRVILEHEHEHIRRKDSVLKLFAFALSMLSPTGLLAGSAISALRKEQEK
mgnify:CR=1 FL=1